MAGKGRLVRQVRDRCRAIDDGQSRIEHRPKLLNDAAADFMQQLLSDIDRGAAVARIVDGGDRRRHNGQDQDKDGHDRQSERGQQTQAGLLACEETLIQSVDFAVVGHWTASYGRQRHSIYRHTELLCELT
ncbi:MAG: hypothetical protein KDE14_03920, partial [Rhodobacteraceae bacterium]|nr:hypothetical protein [Paracoccaceae bacterium]